MNGPPRAPPHVAASHVATSHVAAAIPEPKAVAVAPTSHGAPVAVAPVAVPPPVPLIAPGTSRISWSARSGTSWSCSDSGSAPG